MAVNISLDFCKVLTTKFLKLLPIYLKIMPKWNYKLLKIFLEYFSKISSESCITSYFLRVKP